MNELEISVEKEIKEKDKGWGERKKQMETRPLTSLIVVREIRSI